MLPNVIDRPYIYAINLNLRENNVFQKKSPKVCEYSHMGNR